MEDVIFYGHAAYFTAIRHILWSFGIICGNLVFFLLLVYCAKKSGNPASIHTYIHTYIHNIYSDT
jgi:hypothetical protein